MRPKTWLFGGLTALALMALAGCAGMEKAPEAKPAAPAAKAAPEMSDCVAPDKLTREIAPEAKLESLQCYVDAYQKVPSLHFKVALKNVTDKPMRYRVNIFLDNGKAVGGLIPPDTKKGLVDPGKSVSFVYPIKGQTDKPGEINLIVKKVDE